MTYLNAYRAGSNKYGNDLGRAFKLPKPYIPNTRPPGANDNTPRPANENRPGARKALPYTRAGRALIRRTPYLNHALNAWDLYKALSRRNLEYFQPADYAGAGFTLQHDCGRPGGNFIVGASGFNTPFANTTCPVNQLVSTAIPASDPPTNTIGRFQLYRRTGTYVSGSPLYSASQYWYKPAPDVVLPKTKAQPRLRPARPVISPHLLPIYWPMELPIPLPMPLLSLRLNDPLGSQRSYGDRRLPNTTRKPPPENTKERKIRGIPALVRALTYATTEGLDFLDALHKALPKQYQAKAEFRGGKWWNASPQAKARNLYDNFEHIDWPEAGKNLIVNHFTDLVIGRSSAKAKEFLNTKRITGGVAIFGGGG